jgi:hypothetical protein
MVALIRTLTVTIVLAGVVLWVFWRLSSDQQQRSIDELNALNRQLQSQLAQRDAMVQRLSTTRRIAHVEILGQEVGNASTGNRVTSTELLFIELDERGSELARQRFAIPGDVLFIDALTVKFDHEQVAAGHPLHGRSLVLLRRVYSERMAPADGFVIDTPGAIPPGYASTDAGRYEQRIWASFWDIAADAALARALGVRVAQGEVVYKPVRPGQHYELVVDAAGGISLTPLDDNRPQLSRAGN